LILLQHAKLAYSTLFYRRILILISTSSEHFWASLLCRVCYCPSKTASLMSDFPWHCYDGHFVLFEADRQVIFQIAAIAEHPVLTMTFFRLYLLFTVL